MNQNVSSSGRDKSIGQMIVYGLLTELVLVSIQFIYVEMFVATGEDIAFTNEYMRQTGFILFQVIGFFVYAVITYLLLRRLKSNLIVKVVAFLLAGSAIELVFYLFMQADYAGAFLYSIFDKFVAGAFGALVYYFADKGHKAKSSQV
jgi:hypothetical protein